MERSRESRKEVMARHFSLGDPAIMCRSLLAIEGNDMQCHVISM